MGSKTSSSANSSSSLAAVTSPPTTKTDTTTPPPTTTTTNTTTDPIINNTSAKTNIATVTTKTTTTTTMPTPIVTSTAPTTKNTSATPVSTESNSKSSFFSIAKSLTSNAENPKSAASSAYTQWYKWSKYEQQQRDKGKAAWYLSPQVTSTDTSSVTTTALTMTTAKTSNDQKEIYDASNITVMPSFQLRSTAIYSPPHGDRVLSGRNELINTDVSNFKYYIPDNRTKQTVGQHTRATMYKMNTRLKQTPLPTPSSSSTTTNPSSSNNTTEDNSTVPTFVSIGLQTDLEAQPINSSSSQMLYYERQKPQVVPVSVLSNYNSSNNGFYHLSLNDTVSQPVFPPTETKPSVQLNDQQYPSVNQSLPYYPPPPPPTSILKKPSTVLSQEKYNPLSIQTHDEVLEELRKRNNNTKNGMYRVKKVHILEKDDRENQPLTVPYSLPSSKASQSILRSEKLLFNQ
ncbi:unnamed protein product [Rotaria sp. Silwood2]|nr:unnamed protein product [Rotaria sp. Silwood2]CAF2634275.1 unnamed protein product [Rotaria sp. Silwood2]CAF3035836.1 unnamed protein product [Rotaria sp. Silwood2]CAF3901060.1 unnamed protein product [Rotaria sp. Silwood2]CAF4097997.1 unnamed protein product [Rotaria sp. Silwood2]